MSWDASKIVFGLRHKRNFKFISMRGSLIDAMLSLQGKNGLPDKCFPQVEWQTNDMIFALKGDLGLSMEVGLDGILLTFSKQDAKALALKEIVNTVRRATDILAKIYDSSLKINRLGIVHEFEFEEKDKPAMELSEHLLSKQLGAEGSVEAFSLRHVLRLSDSEALAKRDVCNFRNVIVSIGSKKNSAPGSRNQGDIILSIDYQACYDPEKSWPDIDIDLHGGKARAICNSMKNGALSFLQENHRK